MINCSSSSTLLRIKFIRDKVSHSIPLAHIIPATVSLAAAATPKVTPKPIKTFDNIERAFPSLAILVLEFTPPTAPRL